MSQEITVLIKVFGFIKCLLNNFMLSRTKCLLNNTSKSFTYAYLKFLWMMILPRLELDCAFGVNEFFDEPDSELLRWIFICLRRDLLRSCLLPFWDFLGNCTSFSGHSIEPSSSKEDLCTRECVFFLYLFQLADTCFRRYLSTWNSLIYSRFTWKIEMY